MKSVYTYLILLFLFFTNITFSQIPRIINYQGLLLGLDKQPIPEGEYDLTFGIYDETGNLLWTETHDQVLVTGGLFHIHLGAINPIDLQFDQTYFLGIKVGNEPELEPRIMLTSAAYSLKSANTEALEGFEVSKTPIPNTILPLDSTGMFPSSVIPPDSGGGNGGIGGSGTANYLPRFNNESTLGNSVIYQSGGNLGIGTTNPTVKLELAGSDAKIYGLTLGRGSGSFGTNVTFGYQSLDTNTTGEFNTAIGFNSLHSNTEGYNNSAFGAQALLSNTAGLRNSAFGFESLFHNTTGYDNSAFGAQALLSNTTGYDNSAFGDRALLSNTTGSRNSAFGYEALYDNTFGSYSSAFGVYSLSKNTTGYQNSAFGYAALYNNIGGSGNTAIGYFAGYNLSSGSNNTFVGYNALPSSTSISNEITLGNSDVTTLRCQATTITALSDARDKKNIRDLSLGLEFLMKIKPRLFNWDRREWYEDGKPDGSKMKQKPTAGFIAQELDEAQINEHAEWLNLVLKSNPERLEATPGNLLPIIVEAIQELKNENDVLAAQNLKLQAELKMLQTSFNKLVETDVQTIKMETLQKDEKITELIKQ